MKFLKWLVATVVAIVVLSCGIALFLPSTYSASASTSIDAPVETVFPVVDDVTTWEGWSVWSTRRDPTLVFRYDGPKRGVGATVRWTSSAMGNGRRVVTQSTADADISFELYFDDAQAPAHGHIAFLPRDAGSITTVTWSMQGELGWVLPLRLIRPLLEKMIQEDFAASLQGLKEHCEDEHRRERRRDPHADLVPQTP